MLPVIIFLCSIGICGHVILVFVVVHVVRSWILMGNHKSSTNNGVLCFYF